MRVEDKPTPQPQASHLDQLTMVLDETWLAIHTISVRHALRLLSTGAARGVLPETCETLDFWAWMDLEVPLGGDGIRSVRKPVRVPEIIVLTRYRGVPMRTPSFSRRNLMRRDRHQCQYCGVKPGVHELSIDHVLPRSRGGRSTWENCVLACRRCNRKKRNRTPQQAGMLLLHEPRAPRWSPFVEVPRSHIRPSWQRFVDANVWHGALAG
jgi:5-methylcytosine-specific restriction endonuclease McrA